MQVFESRGLQSHSQSAACVPTETLDAVGLVVPSKERGRAWTSCSLDFRPVSRAPG